MSARPGPRQASLRRTLLLWLLLPLAGLIPLAALLIYGLALSPALDALDRALTDTGVALAEMLETDAQGRVQLPLSEQTARALRADAVDESQFAVADPQGRLLAGQAGLLALVSDSPAPGERRFFNATLAGQALRLAAQGQACGPGGAQTCLIVVAETLGKRALAQRAALLGAGLAALALALPLLGLSLLAVRRALRPLQAAAAQVAALTPQRLEPVPAQALPGEVAGLVQALNELLARLREAAAAQRAFVADAAHQLRTPLAVMRLEAAELLAAPHPEALHPALRRLHAAAERGSRLAQQLLVLARAESQALQAETARPQQALDLSTLAAAAADRWLAPALAAGQDLGFELAPAPLRGDALLLEELLGNLLHNAIEHAGPGVRITVRCGRDAQGRSWLSVEDEGRGVPPEELALLWQRFQRGRAAQGEGSGLGLAIVADIARLHGAVAEAQAGPGGRGLCVSVRFPA